MSYYSEIYGLQLHLTHGVPGLLLSSQPLRPVDVNVHFGDMPSWWREEQVPRKLWYLNPEPGPGGKPRLTVWSLPGHYHLEYADGTQFILDNSGAQIWTIWPAKSLTLEDTATYLLGPIMGFVLLLRGFISLHGCAVTIDDRAVAIVGPAGSGKSTIAAAFAEDGYPILAEDVVMLSDHRDTFLVQPAYPAIRLWPDSVAALYGTAATLPKLTPTWDKRYLDLTQDKYEFQPHPLPLAAIYLLAERSDDDAAPFAQDLTGAEALMSLVANTYATYLMDRQMRAREFELLPRLRNLIPIRRVTPHANPVRIDRLCRIILENFATINSGVSGSGFSAQALHV